MPDTILIDEYTDDDLEVIVKYDPPDDDLTEDEMKTTAELYLDQLLLEEGVDAELPIYSSVRDYTVAQEIFTAALFPKSVKHVTADTIETLVDLETELEDDDGSDLAIMMDTLSGEE